MVRYGVGDVEVHLHHEGEKRESFIEKITEFCRRLRNDHGLLREENGQTAFAFIHGNWALDNSHPDGRCCGLNGEIALLRDLGCYADFTMPSVPSPTQGRIVNEIYWCTSNADNSPKSYDRGINATIGGRLMPRIESGELAGNDLATPERVKGWFDFAPMVGEDLFLKLHTHGAVPRSQGPLLDGGLADLYRRVAEEADRRGIEIHWATAWQMYSAVKALTEGQSPVPVPEAVLAESSR